MPAAAKGPLMEWRSDGHDGPAIVMGEGARVRHSQRRLGARLNF